VCLEHDRYDNFKIEWKKITKRRRINVKCLNAVLPSRIFKLNTKKIWYCARHLSTLIIESFLSACSFSLQPLNSIDDDSMSRYIKLWPDLQAVQLWIFSSIYKSFFVRELHKVDKRKNAAYDDSRESKRRDELI